MPLFCIWPIKRNVNGKEFSFFYRAAFQFGIKMSEGRKTRRAGPKDEKAKLDRDWQKISRVGRASTDKKLFCCITVPFNNMWTLKFKIQSIITLFEFTVVNHCGGPLRKQKRLAQQGQRVMFMCCDWQILIYFVGFCLFVVSQFSL